MTTTLRNVLCCSDPSNLQMQTGAGPSRWLASEQKLLDLAGRPGPGPDSQTGNDEIRSFNKTLFGSKRSGWKLQI